MAGSSPLNQNGRSISLPTRPGPLTPQIDEHLCRLRSSSNANSSTSYSSIGQKLNSLKDLYECVDELLHLPHNQTFFSQDSHSKYADHLLDGSLKLLDACGTAKDILLQTKERIQDIQSVFRRGSGELIINKEVMEYLSSRKVVKKTIKKCLKDIESLCKESAAPHKDGGDAFFPMVGVLRDVEVVTAEIFKSLLCFVSGQKIETKSVLSVVSRLMHQKNDVASKFSSEFENVDAFFISLVSQKKRSGINMMVAENLRTQMVKLEATVQDLDELLESLFRCLVKTRATFLNIISQ